MPQRHGVYTEECTPSLDSKLADETGTNLGFPAPFAILPPVHRGPASFNKKKTKHT